MAPYYSPNSSIVARAPGSLMLMGEYAVLAGYPALVGAINQYIHVTLTPRTDQQVEIISALGHLKQPLDQLTVVEPFQYVLTVLLQHSLTQGVTLHIHSEFASTLGLGSSAAVTVAVLYALHRWQGKTLSARELHAHALRVVHAVQGGGSGADVAASVYGGVLYYRPQPWEVHALPSWPAIQVIYSGSKTTTTQALARFSAAKQPSAVLTQLGELAEQAAQANQRQEWSTLGAAMTAAQQGLDTLGVSTPRIAELLAWLTQQPEILGAKISGAGLGDCVIGLGKVSQPHPAQLAVQLGGLGVFDAH